MSSSRTDAIRHFGSARAYKRLTIGQALEAAPVAVRNGLAPEDLHWIKRFADVPAREAAKRLAVRSRDNPDGLLPPDPAQLAARERFAEAARSGAFKKAGAKKRTTTRKANPTDLSVAQTILAQLGGNRFIAMTGAKSFIGGLAALGFTIPRNSSPANRVTVTYEPGRDLYSMSFIKTSRGGLDSKEVQRFDGLYADQLRPTFNQVTGMETSLGTMGRMSNPAPAQALTGPAVVRLMKQNKVTIPQLAERMNITQTRIRTVREKGVKGNEFVRDWIEGITGRDPYATNPAKPAASRRGNPVKYRDIAKGVAPGRVQYAVHMPDRPSYHAIAYFTKKADAVDTAQELSDRTGKPVAVTRVQVQFGPM